MEFCSGGYGIRFGRFLQSDGWFELDVVWLQEMNENGLVTSNKYVGCLVIAKLSMRWCFYLACVFLLGHLYCIAGFDIH